MALYRKAKPRSEEIAEKIKKTMKERGIKPIKRFEITRKYHAKEYKKKKKEGREYF